MNIKTNKQWRSYFRYLPGGFALFLSALAFSVLGILAAILAYSHYDYKNSQKKLFIEKWDSIAERISRESSKAINSAGLIDDEFASYLYWIPAISKEIVAIKLADNQNNPIYTTGVSGGASELIDRCAEDALNGSIQFIFPKDSGLLHTIIATPIYIDEKIEAVLLLKVNDSPEKIGIKIAIFKPVLFAGVLITLWAAIVIFSFVRLKNKADAAEKINLLQSRLANPASEKSKEIIENGLNDIATVFAVKAGSVYVKNTFSGVFELKAHYPSTDKKNRNQTTVDFEPGDPRLQAITRKESILYNKNTKRPLSLKDIKGTEGEINIALPLISNSIAYGVLNLIVSEKKMLKANSLLRLKKILEIYSFSIFRALEVEQKTSYGDNLLYILDIIESISSADFIKTALGKISEKIASTPAVTFCSIFIMDERNKCLVLVAEAFSGEGLSRKPENIRIDIDEMPVHKVALISGQSQILRYDEIEKLSLNKHNLYNPRMKDSTIQILPLIAGNLRIGCLSLGTVEEVDGSYDKKEFFDNIAHYLSLVLNNLLRYFEIKKSFDQLRATHDKQLKIAKLDAIAELANGISGNLDSTMQLFMNDLDSLRVLKDHGALSEIIESISGHINTYELILEKFKGIYVGSSPERLHLIELATILKTAESRLQEESSKWSVNLDKIRIITLNSGSGQILGDENELFRAISNIVLNAAEAMPYGGDIIIESKVEGKMAILEIKDQGSGMNDSEIIRIFEPFFTTKEGLARGLGLSIAHRIVVHHNGEIVAESEPGKGSRITIKIPLIDPEQTALYSSKKKSTGGLPLSS